MRIYKFQYGHGQSAPYKSLEAANHDDFYAQLARWERDTGFKHIPGIECIVSEVEHVPEPPAAKQRDLFSTVRDFSNA